MNILPVDGSVNKLSLDDLKAIQCQNKTKVDLCLKNDKILNFTAVHDNTVS